MIASPIRAIALGVLVVFAACSEPTAPLIQKQNPDQKQTPAFSMVTEPTLYALGNHTCLLTPASDAYCWGRNTAGQLGLRNNVSPVLTPADVDEPAGVAFVGLGGGTYHTCGVTSGGNAYCWGDNFYGQLGLGGTRSWNFPKLVMMPGGVTFSRVSSGNGNFNCAVATTGAAYCWGLNSSGQLGVGGTTPRSVPTAVLGGHVFQAISAGVMHTCAINSGGQAYCWGANETGRLGTGVKPTTRTRPFMVQQGGLIFSQIVAGRDHTCALTQTGIAYCWGSNTHGQIGINNMTATNRYTPAKVNMPNGGIIFTQLSVGDDHACAIGSNGRIYCWGSNVSGQIGNGSTGNDAYRPVSVTMPGGVLFDAVTSKYHHSCAMSTTDVAYCWGVNTNGELGTNDQFNKPVPTQVQ